MVVILGDLLLHLTRSGFILPWRYEAMLFTNHGSAAILMLFIICVPTEIPSALVAMNVGAVFDGALEPRLIRGIQLMLSSERVPRLFQLCVLPNYNNSVCNFLYWCSTWLVRNQLWLSSCRRMSYFYWLFLVYHWILSRHTRRDCISCRVVAYHIHRLWDCGSGRVVYHVVQLLIHRNDHFRRWLNRFQLLLLVWEEQWSRISQRAVLWRPWLVIIYHINF